MDAAIAYLVSASLLLFLCHRWLRRLSVTAFLVLLLMPLCFTGRALLTGRVYAPSDLAFDAPPLRAHRAAFGVGADASHGVLSDVNSFIIPWRKATRFAIERFRWPTWNPFLRCGDVLAASAQPAPYYPISVVSYALPLATSLTFSSAAVFLLAGLSAFVYLRSLGCDEGPALLGAAAWMYCDFLVQFLGWPLGVAAATFPLTLLGVRLVARSPDRRSILVLALAFLLVLLAGHPETAVHQAFLAALYFLFELSGAIRSRRLRACMSAGVAAALALCLSAVFVLPIAEAAPQSSEYKIRRATFREMPRSVSAAEAGDRLQANVIPFLFGTWGGEAATDRPAFWSGGAYGGSIVLALAVLALILPGPRERWWLASMALLGCLAAASAPGVSELLAQVPLLDVSINERLAFAGAFALAALSALGAQAWSAAQATRRVRAARMAVCGCVVATALLLWHLWPRMRLRGLSVGFLETHGAWLLVPLVLVAALALVRTLSARAWCFACLALLLVQRVAESGNLYPTLPRESFYPVVAPLDSVPRGGQPLRIVGTGSTLTPNISALYELEDVRGYQALNFERMVETFPLWSVPNGIWYNRVDDVTRPFLSFLNVRYALISRPARVPAGWRVLASAQGTALAENPEVLPRAFVPALVRLSADGPAQLKEMAGAEDFRQRAWIERPSEEERAVADDLPNGPGEVDAREEPDGYTLNARMQNAGWVVVSVTAWRGWHAFEDGRELPLSFANHAFLGFHLPAGPHRIDLVYSSAAFRWGRAVSLATTLLLLLLLVRRRVTQGRLLRRGHPVDIDVEVAPFPGSLPSATLRSSPRPCSARAGEDTDRSSA